ncbi:MAG TPA: iron-sulfur cluster assembly protein [Thermoplasmata archaeon]|nr:iron-sulfur cluster assembly protein [Thermoplasmata archaeon]
MSKTERAKDPSATNTDGLTIHVQPAARSELARALSVRSPATVVRLFVEPGIHPRVAMILDTARPSDLKVTVDDIPIVLDVPGRRFLDGATIDFVTGDGTAGFRVTGPNIPSTTPEAPTRPAGQDPRGYRTGAVPPSGSRGEVEQAIMSELKKLYDPEIPMNIVDLGLIYGLEWKDDTSVTVRMTMTSPGCPVIEVLCDEVKGAALRAPGVRSAHVDVVWDPPWGPDKMTELARRQLGFA